VDSQDALADFIACVIYPNASAATSHARAEDILIPFQKVPVFHKIRFVAGNCNTIDAVHVRPKKLDVHGCFIPARFDTVLVKSEQDHVHRNKDMFLHIKGKSSSAETTLEGGSSTHTEGNVSGSHVA
jgi:hypothetical protein